MHTKQAMTYTEESFETDAELIAWLLVHGFADAVQYDTDMNDGE